MPKQHEIIGIVGGLGPYAHIDFERKLLESARELLNANRDKDYPEWILSSIPQTPDRSLAIAGQAADPLPYLLRGLRRVDESGADFAVIPCNTAHHYIDALRDGLSIPILSMVEETAAHIRSAHPEARVGILATTGTLNTRIYHEALSRSGLEALSPLDLPGGETVQRDLVMAAIYGPWKDGAHAGGGIKAQGPAPELDSKLIDAAKKLIEILGATVIITACTEIPLAMPGREIAGVLIVDPSHILARATIRRAYHLP